MANSMASWIWIDSSGSAYSNGLFEWLCQESSSNCYQMIQTFQFIYLGADCKSFECPNRRCWGEAVLKTPKSIAKERGWTFGDLDEIDKTHLIHQVCLEQRAIPEWDSSNSRWPQMATDSSGALSKRLSRRTQCKDTARKRSSVWPSFNRVN